MTRVMITVLLGACLLAIPATAQSNVSLRTLDRDLARATNPLRLPDDPSVIAGRPLPVNSREREPNEVLADDPYQPLTTGQKWHHFVKRTYSPATFIGAGENTAFTYITGGFLYCCGIGAWGKQYGATVADTESRQFFANFLFPTLLKQDPRYFPKREGNFFSRSWYAVTRVVVTRNDRGAEVFNSSELLGVAFSRALANAYYPPHHRTLWNTTNSILGTLQGDATSNLLREFWPEIRNVVHKHTPKELRPIEQHLPMPNSNSQY